MLSGLPPHIQQRVAVLVPLVALALSIFFVYPGWVQWRKGLAETEDLGRQLAEIKATPIPLASAREPGAEDTPSEPPEFFAKAREVAQAAGCRIVGFDLTLPPAPPSGEKEIAMGGNETEEQKAARKAKEKPPLIRPVRAKFELESNYMGIRRFMMGIIQAPRLYAIASVEITAPNLDNPGVLKGVVEIERYIRTAAAVPAPEPPK